jgi:hypothetical protein
VWSLGAIGIVIEYVVWTMGIGAACATRWRAGTVRRHDGRPPPVTGRVEDR